MLEIVLWFAAITATGELLILYHLPRGIRTWILRNTIPRGSFHFVFAALNLWIHWGTVTGSMTAVTAFVVSVAVFRAADLL